MGYSPILVVDAETILRELPGAHFLHVVRNPGSAYADPKKRPVPLSLAPYMLGWCLNQHCALLARERFPDRFHLLRTEDTLEGAFPGVRAVGLEESESLATPTLERRAAAEAYPGGRSGRRRPKRTAPPPRSSPRRSARRCASGPACFWRRWATPTSSPDAVLVTGAAGFVGANLVRRLLAAAPASSALVRPGGDRGGSRGSTWTWSRPTCASLSRAVSASSTTWPPRRLLVAGRRGAIRETNVLGTENALRAGRAGRRRGVVVRVRAEGARARRGRGSGAEQRVRGREGRGDRARAGAGRGRAAALLRVRSLGGA